MGCSAAASRAAWPTAADLPVAGSIRTTEGSEVRPSGPAISRGPAAVQWATSELVVPRSMPTMGEASASGPAGVGGSEVALEGAFGGAVIAARV